MRKSNMLDALFPRTRQVLLSTLLLRPERRWYLSDLAQQLKVSPSSLQRELASLVEAGILRREADGNRVYYQTEPEFPLLPELQGIFAKTLGLADQIKAALLSVLEAADVAFIFGSVARGEQMTQSDVDLMIIGPLRMADVSLALRGLECSLGIPINVNLYTRSEWKEKFADGHHFLRTVMQDRKIFLKGTEHELADVAGKSAHEKAYNQPARG